LNWIIKDRILAFASPQYERNISKEGYCALTPADYIPYFQKKNVSLVVRLNKQCYDESDFIKKGINHFDQYYLDGSCPPMKILQKVLTAFEQVPADRAFAVHCKAGLGRTGTCIGAYIMKHYKFTAAEAIGWMRICRPGMVIGPQQHFLADIEQRMWDEGDNMKLKPAVSIACVSPDDSDRRIESKKDKETLKGSPLGSLRFGALTMDERLKSGGKDAVVGREGQAEGLLARRNKSNQRSSNPLEMMEC
jgi:protein-tyrosine phosphatase